MLDHPIVPFPWEHPAHHPELKVSTPANTKQLGWYVEFEIRVTHRMLSSDYQRIPNRVVSACCHWNSSHAGRKHAAAGTKEMINPCLIHLHVISLVAQVAVGADEALERAPLTFISSVFFEGLSARSWLQRMTSIPWSPEVSRISQIGFDRRDARAGTTHSTGTWPCTQQPAVASAPAIGTGKGMARSALAGRNDAATRIFSAERQQHHKERRAFLF